MNILLAVCAIVLVIPMMVYIIECAAAIVPRRARKLDSNGERAGATIIIPAHNEAGSIERTVASVQEEMSAADRLIVISDNSTDDTAARAREAGAEVFERNDAERRGKGYALSFGLDQIAVNPPAVVVFVDADCELAFGSLNALVRQATRTGAPAQGVYLLAGDESPSSREAVSRLAFVVKNLVRPMGLDHLELPCLLTGTGMAFPWEMIRAAPLAGGNIVEDMQLGIDLAIAGSSPRLCAGAHIRGASATNDDSARAQRTRWEHGHLRTLTSQGPRLVRAAAMQGRGDLLALALELTVPPLSLLVAVVFVGTVLATFAALLGAWWWPASWLASGLAGVVVVTLLAWWKHGRAHAPGRALLAAPAYILWKLPLYAKFFVKPETEWVRTERAGERTNNRDESADAASASTSAEDESSLDEPITERRAAS